MKAGNHYLSSGRYSSARVLLGILCLVCFLFALLTQAEAETSVSREYKIKSVLIYNFMKFIDWPEKSKPISDANDPKIFPGGPTLKLSDQDENNVFIALVTEPEIYKICKLVQGREVKGKTIKVKRFSHRQLEDPNVLLSYDLVYITSPPKSLHSFDTGSILNKMKHHRILTIGESPQFLKGYGMINFVPEKNNVCFEINLDIMQEEGFVIKAQLLRLAKRVIKKPSR